MSLEETLEATDLAGQSSLSLREIAQHPIVTYGLEFAGRTRIDASFATAGLHPDVVLEASDSDVIKTYVGLGLGVGIVSSLAIDKNESGGALVALPFKPALFSNDTFVAYRKGRLLKRFEQLFVQSLITLPTRASPAPGPAK